MANSKYEYVKSFELDDEIFPPNIIVVLVQGHNFLKSYEHCEFEKPYDETAWNLMNACGAAVFDEYPDIVFSYGFSDEFSFVFKKTTQFYQRRSSKVLSIIVSFFASQYATKWKEFFPQVVLKYPPYFHSQVIPCASIVDLQTYFGWRQNKCHMNTQEVEEYATGSEKQGTSKLFFQQSGIGYKRLPEMYHHGSCIFKIEVKDIVKFREDGTPVQRLRRKVIVVHPEDIGHRSFWNEKQSLLKELGSFPENICEVKPEYSRSFIICNKLMPSTWIVIRIDGCHFHRFSDVHKFEKPNDDEALNLMNSCAVAVLEEFQDIVFAYGVSDEFSFVLKRDSQLCERKASDIVSSVVSCFSSAYVIKWKDFKPHKELKYPPSFDGRAVCYPSFEILHDYLAWRQVDCHINNQYNTCFWMLVKSGKTKREAQDHLKGTQAADKNDLLTRLFGINYYELPIMFRQGSSVFRFQDDKESDHEHVASAENLRNRVIVEHDNIIEKSFWEEHPNILGANPNRLGGEENNTCHTPKMELNRFDYFKSFEITNEVVPGNIIVVRIDGHNFLRFSEVHQFERPNDVRALNLMNTCAAVVLDQYPDAVLAYGFSDEFSFVFKKTSKFYQSKILPEIVSVFSSVYAKKWRDFFPQTELRFPSSFHGRTIHCATLEVLQSYLAWRQNECHVVNQQDTCLWMLSKCGKSEHEAQEYLEGTRKKEKNELLFRQFGINYNNLPKMFRQGSCILKTEGENMGVFTPVESVWKKLTIIHSENIAGKIFWNEQHGLHRDLGAFTEDINNVKPEYVRSFLFEDKVMLSTWIVIRIGGCMFHRCHELKKPNDEQDRKLMNLCSASVLEEFQDLAFYNGAHDEYSFVLKKDSQLFQRRASDIMSTIVSFFTSSYVMKWKDFYPHHELKYPPYFNGRILCFPTSGIMQDYLGWTQVDEDREARAHYCQLNGYS